MKTNYQSFLGWECQCSRKASAEDYDVLIDEMRDILRNHSLIGFHCTKLTDTEVEGILRNGMLLQSPDLLHYRVSQLKQAGLITCDIASSLLSNNQCHENNRKNMLWFCFFEPHLVGRTGIERFFRSWGGEALYNSHEQDDVTGRVLRAIGKPCVIKAKVPIESLNRSCYPDGPIIRVFLSNMGHTLQNGILHEGFSEKVIEPHKIIEIFEYPSVDFYELTQSRAWIDPSEV